MLVINQLTKQYAGSNKGIFNLSLHVEPKDIYGFIGHNGAGKTTTLKAIAGIHDYDKGSIIIGGHDLQKEPLVCKKEMAYIPDNPELFDYLTGIQYLNFIADIFEVKEDVRQQRIQHYATELEIMESLGDLIFTYSHGMKQKLAILSALIHEPKLWILDEPFVGLDPKATILVKQMMKEHCNKGGAVFFSTHVLDVAEKLCNKVAIIKDGQSVLVGDMESLLKKGESLEDIFMEVVNHD